MVNTEIRLIIFFAAKDGEALYSIQSELPYDPAIPLLGIHTEEIRIERHVYPSVHHSTVYNSQDMEAS